MKKATGLVLILTGCRIAGGATRAELDALRLIAVLLADWDNKSENQRLVCLDGVRLCRGASLRTMCGNYRPRCDASLCRCSRWSG